MYLGLKKHLNIEYLILSILLLVLFLLSIEYSGGPIHYDELWYMQESVKPVWSKDLTNRYYHVYLQKLFFFIANSPLSGVKLLWSVQIILTIGLIYICTKLICDNIISALIAVFLFCSHNNFGQNIGNPQLDYSPMMWVSISTTIFLLYKSTIKYKNILLFFVGLCFYSACKSKETGIVIGILIIGMIFIENNKLSVLDISKKVLYVISGIFVSFILLVILDLSFSYSLIVNNWKDYFFPGLGYVTESYPPFRDASNWYTVMFKQVTVLPFILYILLLSKLIVKNNDLYLFTICLVPLSLIIFLSIVKIFWLGLPLIQRYFLPVYPIFCILAALNFNFIQETLFNRNNNKMNTIITILLISCVVLIVYSDIFNKFISYVNPTNFYTAILFPLLLSILIITFCLSYKKIIINCIVSLFCIFTLTYVPIQSSLMYIGTKNMLSGVNVRFSPYTSFAEYLNVKGEIDEHNNIKENYLLLVTTGMANHIHLFASNQKENQRMYSIIFNKRLSEKYFAFGGAEKIFTLKPTHVLLHYTEWDILEDLKKEEIITLGYKILLEPKDKLFYLLYNPSAVPKV